MRNNKVDFTLLLTLLSSVLTVSLPCYSAAGSSKASVLFVMVDDMGYADLGVTGGRNSSTVYLPGRPAKACC